MSHTGSPLSGLHLRDTPAEPPGIVSPTVLSGIRQRWTLLDIPWGQIDRVSMAGQEELLFYLVVSASFIETATDTYTQNLVDHYAGDDQVTAWLEQRWEVEELQHGRALRRYAELTWPRLDWSASYRAFFSEFSAKCQDDGLESSRCLEAVSRCLVEAGTASYYTALSRLSPEPVLTTLASLIREDEVRHYKYFYRYFQSYREREHRGRLRIFLAIVRRLRMMDMGDSYIALKHAYLAWNPGAAFDRPTYRKVQTRIRHLMGPHFPLEMSARMSLKPLDLSPRVQKMLVPLLVFLCHRLLCGEGFTSLTNPG